MNAQQNAFNPFRRTILTIALLSVGLVLSTETAAQLQQQAVSSPAEGWATLLAQEGQWTKSFTGEARPSTLSEYDLSGLTKQQWKQLKKEQLTALRSEQEHVWQQALQNVIFLSTFYREKVNFGRAASPLLEFYLFDRNEQHRIMALAGLHAIGKTDGMAHLAQRVQLERSPRVRRLTLAALADHYGIRDDYGRRAGVVRVGEPTVVTGR